MTETDRQPPQTPDRDNRDNRGDRDAAGRPKLRMPPEEICDRGVVRLGCSMITGDFPVYRR